MGKKLYVGGLPYGITEETLTQTFQGAGAVDNVSIITDRETGRPKGFGFVEMTTEEEAQKAIQMLNNTQMDGRTIVVNEARPRTEGGDRRSSGGNRSYSRR
ncbi:MAG: RNA-binding protein [Candidatus Eremiobacteraeota bacterium]|nr:RNA-binding protein [Candidatus Eremiobacteraeota bacterium]